MLKGLSVTFAHLTFHIRHLRRVSTRSTMSYLYAAYIAMAVIHLGYIFSLNQRAARLRRDIEESRR